MNGGNEDRAVLVGWGGNLKHTFGEREKSRRKNRKGIGKLEKGGHCGEIVMRRELWIQTKKVLWLDIDCISSIKLLTKVDKFSARLT